jgi:hypothetical protein
MSGKIIDARIQQLKSLRDRRDDLIEKIQKEKEGMQVLLYLMDGETGILHSRPQEPRKRSGAKRRTSPSSATKKPSRFIKWLLSDCKRITHRLSRS